MKIVRAEAATVEVEGIKIVTVKDVPIVGVGTYALSTGTTTFTEEDLIDAVLAAEDDPSVKAPRVKIGHAETGWQAGEPAFGVFYNLRLSDNGQEILADVDVPDWLAEVMPIAYPNRSIEGIFGYTSSTTGKSYRLVITAVALLGIELPGVTTLDDLREVLTNPEVTIVATKAARPKVTVRAQVDSEDVRREFFNTVAQGDRYWWWPRSIRLDPNEVICEDEETGTLYRVPFTISEREITFGEPTEVYIEYQDETKKEEEPAKAVIGSWHKASAARSRFRATEEVKMDPKELREQLGLPEDATDEDVKAKIDELKAAAEQPPKPGENDDDEEEKPEQNDDPTAPAPSPPANEPTTASSGVVQVDAAALDQLKRDAQMGREAREQQLRAERNSVLDEAVKAGKFPPSRREHFSKLLAADEEGTKKLIKDLEANVIPIDARGGSTPGPDEVEAGGDSSYPVEWLTDDERARVAAARKGA